MNPQWCFSENLISLILQVLNHIPGEEWVLLLMLSPILCYHLEPKLPIFIDLLSFRIYLSNIKIFLQAVWMKCAEISHVSQTEISLDSCCTFMWARTHT